MIADEEISELLRRRTAGNHSYEWAIREAVRLTAERCADLCQSLAVKDCVGYSKEGNAAADFCAAAIREQIKPKTYFNPNEGFGPI